MAAHQRESYEIRFSSDVAALQLAVDCLWYWESTLVQDCP